VPKQENGFFVEERQTGNLKDKLYVYISKWPLFFVLSVISVGAGVFYIRHTPSKYLAETTVIVKNAEENKTSKEDLIETALDGKSEVNLNNEIILLGSSTLMKRTVAKNAFNIQYLIKGRLVDIDVYKDAPFILNPQEIINPKDSFEIQINQMNTEGGSFLHGPKKKEKKFTFRWREPFFIGRQGFILYPKRVISNSNAIYIVKYIPVSAAADDYSSMLAITRPDVKSSAIDLKLKTENLEKGVDILNAFVKELNESDIEDRIKISNNTVSFIDERLLAISGDLKNVEGNLEAYQGNNQLVDIKGQSAQSLENSAGVSTSIKNITNQQAVATMLIDYFNNPANDNKLIPSSMGLTDPNLSSLIAHFNEVQLKKQREEPFVTPNSIVMQDLNTQIQNLKSIILQSLNNISIALKNQENGFQEQNNQYKTFLSSVPHNERALQEIKRKQTITEGLYLYLFQKREEAAISSTAANTPHYIQFDPASGFGPIEPSKLNILVYSALLGLLLAFGLVYLMEALNDKVRSVEEVSKKLHFPIVGEISHKAKVRSLEIVVYDRSLVSEQFRSIRSLLSFQLKNKKNKCILVTSSTSGEGKSFNSLNLAAVFAIPGKKVALLEFDIRKPVLHKVFNLKDNCVGLTEYLTEKETDFSKISYSIEQIPSLHFYPAGSLSTNPADLLLSENLRNLFKSLKEEYDYIVVDSPPVGLVSDSLVLSEYCDSVLFVVRQDKTLKKNLNIVKSLGLNKSFVNVGLIMNDVRSGDKAGYQNYEKAYEKQLDARKKRDLVS
jgi:capsular exopolysaccharide synthesis family protein